MNDIKFEVVKGEEMTREQVESIAQILFNWWKRDFESGKISQEKKDENALVSDKAIKHI
jgi:hypothetical protein